MLECRHDADEWWAELEPAFRVFYRDVVSMAQDLLGEEVLLVRFTGSGFTPQLISKEPLAIREGRPRDRFGGCQLTPEVWWERLGQSERGFIQKLARLFPKLQRDPDQCLEFKRIPGGFRVEQVLKFKWPVFGKAELN